MVLAATATALASCATLAGPPIDKFAQLALGKAYEAGDGVPIDYRKAASLYRSAAFPTSGTTYVYSPPVGRSRGRVIPIRTGVAQQGLAEAKFRLGRLYELGLGVGQNAEKGRQLKEQARSQGFYYDNSRDSPNQLCQTMCAAR